MDSQNPLFDSREAALSVAKAYESTLATSIQLSRLQDDPEYVKYIHDHLESAKKYHKIISKVRRGSGDWETFCRTELILMKDIMEECITKIQNLII